MNSLTIILPVVTLGLTTWLVTSGRFFRIAGIKRSWVTGAWILKVIAGLGMTLLYQHHFEQPGKADIFRYLEDGRIMASVFKSDPGAYFSLLTGLGNGGHTAANTVMAMDNWYHAIDAFGPNTNRTLIRFHSMLCLVSAGNIHLHYIVYSFLVFTCLILLFRRLRSSLPGKEKMLFMALFLIPSAMFWTSNVLKEGVALCGLALLVAGLVNLARSREKLPLHIAELSGGLLLILLSRPYLFILAGIATILYLVVNRFSSVIRTVSFAATSLILLLLVFLLHTSGSGFDPLGFILDKQALFLTHAMNAEAGSLIRNIPDPGPGFRSFLVSLAHGLWNAVAIPYPGQQPVILSVLIFLETLAIGVSAVWLVRGRVNGPTGGIGHMLLFITLAGLIVIGLSVPVAGAIVRYRSILLLTGMVALLCFSGRSDQDLNYFKLKTKNDA